MNGDYTDTIPHLLPSQSGSHMHHVVLYSEVQSIEGSLAMVSDVSQHLISKPYQQGREAKTPSRLTSQYQIVVTAITKYGFLRENRREKITGPELIF